MSGGRIEKGRKVRVEDQVYCLEHGEVHEDTLDPYGEGRESCWDNLYGERSKAMVHRTLFYGARKGDYIEGER